VNRATAAADCTPLPVPRSAGGNSRTDNPPNAVSWTADTTSSTVTTASTVGRSPTGSSTESVQNASTSTTCVLISHLR
jgi:hypothetical protein